METQSSESEKFITNSVINFINEHTKSNHLSSLDEIVLSYVVTVLENLATERDEDLMDSFDVEEFCEMLSAYFPEFASIPQVVVSTWIFELVTSLKNSNKKEATQKGDIAFDTLLGEIVEREPRTKRYSESSSDSSCNGSTKKSTSTSRTPRVSENSDCECDVVDIIQRLQLEEKTETLMEMFPDLPRADAQNLVSLSNGDLEKSVQMVLLQLEGARLNGGQNGVVFSVKPRLNSKSDVDEKVLKDRIVARYGFIDQAEDSKEFKPALPKAEPKKLVRYRESQVVSTKGERYSEVRCTKDGEEVKVKTYISKPHRPSN